MNKRSRYLMMGFSAMFLIFSVNSMFASAYIPFWVYVDDVVIEKGTSDDENHPEYLEPGNYDNIEIDSEYWETGYHRIEYELYFSSPVDGQLTYTLHFSHTLHSVSRDLTVYLIVDLNDDGIWNSGDGIHYCGDYDSGSYTYSGYHPNHDILGVYCYTWRFLGSFSMDLESCYISGRYYF